MTKTLTITALGLMASAAGAAPTADFSGADFIIESANSGRLASGIINDFAPIDGPVVMFADAPENPSHLKPTKPGQGNLGVKESGKDTKTVVVPLPAPAGLAIAGLLLVGSIRRR